MAGTFSQIYIHLVFAVQNRESMIQPSWEEELYKYTTGIVQNKKQKMLAINGMPDHVHIFIGMRPHQSISALIQNVKTESSKWIKAQNLSSYPFAWQEGYGAFSYSHSALDNVIGYINNQKMHHKRQTFRDEYLEFLRKFQIDFKDEYLFEWID